VQQVPRELLSQHGLTRDDGKHREDPIQGGGLSPLKLPTTKSKTAKRPVLLESGGPGEKSAFGKHLYTVEESSSLADSPADSKESVDGRNKLQLAKDMPGASPPPSKPGGSDTPSSAMTFQGLQPNKFSLPYTMPRKLTHIKEVSLNPSSASEGLQPGPTQQVPYSPNAESDAASSLSLAAQLNQRRMPSVLPIQNPYILELRKQSKLDNWGKHEGSFDSSKCQARLGADRLEKAAAQSTLSKREANDEVMSHGSSAHAKLLMNDKIRKRGDFLLQ
jgi:hypothetical protein